MTSPGISFFCAFSYAHLFSVRKIEIEELAKHGTMLPPDIMGLTDEQVKELKLKDEWSDKCVPMGGWTFNKDQIGRYHLLMLAYDNRSNQLHEYFVAQ